MIHFLSAGKQIVVLGVHLLEELVTDLRACVTFQFGLIFLERGAWRIQQQQGLPRQLRELSNALGVLGLTLGSRALGDRLHKQTE